MDVKAIALDVMVVLDVAPDVRVVLDAVNHVKPIVLDAVDVVRNVLHNVVVDAILHVAHLVRYNVRRHVILHVQVVQEPVLVIVVAHVHLLRCRR